MQFVLFNYHMTCAPATRYKLSLEEKLEMLIFCGIFENQFLSVLLTILQAFLILPLTLLPQSINSEITYILETLKTKYQTKEYS